MRPVLMISLLLLAAIPAHAQNISVSSVRASVADEIAVTQGGMSCTAGQTDVLFDTIVVPATATKDPALWTIRVPSTLAARHYGVRLRCGASTSQPVGLDVSAPVICAMNLTPKPSSVKPADERCSADNVWELRMGDRISLTVKNLDQLFGTSTSKPLHLVLADVELKNVELHRGGLDPGGADTLSAVLAFDNTPANRKAWVEVLQTARDNENLSISITQEGLAPLATSAKINLNLYPVGYTAFAAVVVVGLLVLLVVLGRRSNLLRDATGTGATGPYSLAKHQMAVWFFVVISAYLFVSVLTGTAAATSPTALMLIGISGATGLAAIAIDGGKRAEMANDLRARQAEQAAITQALNDPLNGLNAQLAKAMAGSVEAIQLMATIQAKAQRLAELAAQLAKVQPVPRPKQAWYLDLLSDENGISFHRLQMAGWTVVLVGVFVRGVWRDFAMPDFDATTLGLMGISSGTYLGFKFPEQK
jgi:hypothetical protein